MLVVEGEVAVVRQRADPIVVACSSSLPSRLAEKPSSCVRGPRIRSCSCECLQRCLSATVLWNIGTLSQEKYSHVELIDRPWFPIAPPLLELESPCRPSSLNENTKYYKIAYKFKDFRNQLQRIRRKERKKEEDRGEEEKDQENSGKRCHHACCCLPFIANHGRITTIVTICPAWHFNKQVMCQDTHTPNHNNL